MDIFAFLTPHSFFLRVRVFLALGSFGLLVLVNLFARSFDDPDPEGRHLAQTRALDGRRHPAVPAAVHERPRPVHRPELQPLPLDPVLDVDPVEDRVDMRVRRKAALVPRPVREAERDRRRPRVARLGFLREGRTEYLPPRCELLLTPFLLLLDPPLPLGLGPLARLADRVLLDARPVPLGPLPLQLYLLPVVLELREVAQVPLPRRVDPRREDLGTGRGRVAVVLGQDPRGDRQLARLRDGRGRVHYGQDRGRGRLGRRGLGRRLPLRGRLELEPLERRVVVAVVVDYPDVVRGRVRALLLPERPAVGELDHLPRHQVRYRDAVGPRRALPRDVNDEEPGVGVRPAHRLGEARRRARHDGRGELRRELVELVRRQLHAVSLREPPYRCLARAVVDRASPSGQQERGRGARRRCRCGLLVGALAADGHRRRADFGLSRPDRLPSSYERRSRAAAREGEAL